MQGGFDVAGRGALAFDPVAVVGIHAAQQIAQGVARGGMRLCPEFYRLVNDRASAFQQPRGCGFGGLEGQELMRRIVHLVRVVSGNIVFLFPVFLPVFLPINIASITLINKQYIYLTR
ncbi:hypothetical protein D3C78_1560250 [compost metagenome]